MTGIGFRLQQWVLKAVMNPRTPNCLKKMALSSSRYFAETPPLGRPPHTLGSALGYRGL